MTDPANDNAEYTAEYTAEFVAEAEAYLASLRADETADQKRARELAGLWQDVYDGFWAGEIGRDDALTRLAPIRRELSEVARRLGDWPHAQSIRLLGEVGFGDAP